MIKNAKFSGHCFIWTQIYWKIFKSALVYIEAYVKLSIILNFAKYYYVKHFSR